ncbi:hypothetical protein CIHG_08037 [Coccidioides immitis H538.4]|uniref:Uncharacterized protein n=3 Tax=Coccidioides immitis TaxID=5501 RepID=A0A0J8QV01_COCIT|nr:hypothetical protein CIRG_09008 [Coccidioides immitis RMSCC 2394]KMU75078.1 hypothetical protein CISG_04365 [Coccidioides immitis RMSCC 3703]KMU90227.1 hypothetical protein CIHG_08037 [Coccidioides immitis H538.4]
MRMPMREWLVARETGRRFTTYAGRIENFASQKRKSFKGASLDVQIAMPIAPARTTILIIEAEAVDQKQAIRALRAKGWFEDGKRDYQKGEDGLRWLVRRRRAQRESDAGEINDGERKTDDERGLMKDERGSGDVQPSNTNPRGLFFASPPPTRTETGKAQFGCG